MCLYILLLHFFVILILKYDISTQLLSTVSGNQAWKTNKTQNMYVVI